MTVALRAARAFDGDRLVVDPLVLIDGGTITAVESGRVAPPEGAEVHDFGDATIVPGLIDAHVHLAFDSGDDAVAFACEADHDVLLSAMRRHAHAALMAGVTTVRDLGDHSFLALRLRDELRSDHAAGANIVAAGPPLTVREGHLHYFGGVVDDADSARSTVRRWKDRGVDVIKVVASGGELTPGTDPFVTTMPTDVMEAIVAEAHEVGLMVTVHAHSPDAISLAVNAGADGVEHGLFLTPGGVEARRAELENIARRQIALCPTHARLPGAVPTAPRMRDRFSAMLELVGTMHRMGVRLINGSDAGIRPSKPHGVLPHGVGQFVDVGLSTTDALRASTSVAAEGCGLDAKGRIAPSFDADILVAGGNPIEDPQALLDVRAVFRSGTRVR